MQQERLVALQPGQKSACCDSPTAPASCSTLPKRRMREQKCQDMQRADVRGNLHDAHLEKAL